MTLCGEMGGRTLEAMALMALGFREFSMSATSIGPIKAMILSLNSAWRCARSMRCSPKGAMTHRCGTAEQLAERLQASLATRAS